MPTTTHVSFAGTTLPLVTPFLDTECLRFIHEQKNFLLADFWTFDQSNAWSLSTPDAPVPPEFSIGKLYLPTGACRPAWYHFLAETNRVDQFRSLIGTPQSLVLYDGREDKTITASMYCLPPRPLNQLG